MDTFREAVRAWVQSRDTAREDLAKAMEVSISCVDRWWLGTATPHPILQGVILTWIRQRTK